MMYYADTMALLYIFSYTVLDFKCYPFDFNDFSLLRVYLIAFFIFVTIFILFTFHLTCFF